MEKWEQEIEDLKETRKMDMWDQIEETLTVKEAVDVFERIKGHVRDIEPPQGIVGEVISMILSYIEKSLRYKRRKTFLYAVFQLGMAYERYQRERSSGKP